MEDSYILKPTTEEAPKFIADGFSVFDEFEQSIIADSPPKSGNCLFVRIINYCDKLDTLKPSIPKKKVKIRYSKYDDKFVEEAFIAEIGRRVELFNIIGLHENHSNAQSMHSPKTLYIPKLKSNSIKFIFMKKLIPLSEVPENAHIFPRKTKHTCPKLKFERKPQWQNYKVPFLKEKDILHAGKPQEYEINEPTKLQILQDSSITHFTLNGVCYKPLFVKLAYLSHGDEQKYMYTLLNPLICDAEATCTTNKSSAGTKPDINQLPRMGNLVSNCLINIECMKYH